MVRSPSPLEIVPASFLAYSFIFRRFVLPGSEASLIARHKALSACHALIVTLLVLYALRKSPLRWGRVLSRNAHPKYATDGHLDDSENPLIRERSQLANAITAWETGYLLFDTWAMIRHGQSRSSQKGLAGSMLTTAKKQPAFFGHHVALSAAFLSLQYYIQAGRERGIWIIAAFLVMNGSNPLLHGRWWMRKTRGPSRSMDLSFAATFAVLRFGTIAWVLSQYGTYHGLGAWKAYRQLRTACQLGTGALFGLNALWWSTLIHGIIRRSIKR